MRDWAAIAPSTVSFKNCFKIRKEEFDVQTVPVPHSFTFMARQDMPNQGLGIQKVERMPNRLKSPNDTARDIFVMVKSRMSSTTLCQDPVLCMPTSLQTETTEFLRKANLATCPKKTWGIEQERVGELSLLARALERDFPHMTRAVTWYTNMLKGKPENMSSVPELSFLRNAPAVPENLHDFQLGARAPEPRPHCLQVSFHRGL